MESQWARICMRDRVSHLLRQRSHVSRGCQAAHLEARARRYTHRIALALHTARAKVVLLSLLRRTRLDVVECVGVRAAQTQLARFAVLDAEVLPVEERGEALNAITLVDALAAGALREVEHVVRQVVDALLDGFGATVNDVAAFVFRSVDKVLHEAAETGKVGGD